MVQSKNFMAWVPVLGHLNPMCFASDAARGGFQQALNLPQLPRARAEGRALQPPAEPRTGPVSPNLPPSRPRSPFCFCWPLAGRRCSTGRLRVWILAGREVMRGAGSDFHPCPHYQVGSPLGAQGHPLSLLRPKVALPELALPGAASAPGALAPPVHPGCLPATSWAPLPLLPGAASAPGALAPPVHPGCLPATSWAPLPLLPGCPPQLYLALRRGLCEGVPRARWGEGGRGMSGAWRG